MQYYLYNNNTLEFMREVKLTQIDPVSTKKQGKPVYAIPALATSQAAPETTERQKAFWDGHGWTVVDLPEVEDYSEKVQALDTSLKSAYQAYSTAKSNYTHEQNAYLMQILESDSSRQSITDTWKKRKQELQKALDTAHAEWESIQAERDHWRKRHTDSQKQYQQILRKASQAAKQRLDAHSKAHWEKAVAELQRKYERPTRKGRIHA